MSLYGRRVRVSVGPREGTGREWLSVRGRDCIRIGFDVVRDDSSDADQGSVMLWNLARSTRDWLDENAELVALDAGFGDMAGRIWSADVARVQHVRTGADWVTTIEGGDSEDAIARSTLSVAFAAGSTGVDVLNALAGALGVSVGYAPDEVRNRRSARGTSVAGNAMDRLQELAADADCVVTIQDGSLYMYPVSAGSVEVSIAVSPDMGLQTQPQPLRLTGASRDDDRPGITFRAMMDDRIVPGRRITVRDTDAHTGDWVVRSARYVGDSQEGDYYIQVEATLYEP